MRYLGIPKHLHQITESLVIYSPFALTRITRKSYREAAEARRRRQVHAAIGCVWGDGSPERPWGWLVPEPVFDAYEVVSVLHPERGRWWGDEAWMDPGFRAAQRALADPAWFEELERAIDVAETLSGKDAVGPVLLAALPDVPRKPRWDDLPDLLLDPWDR